MTNEFPWLLPTLPAEPIVARYRGSPGNELGSGKLDSPQSSAALVANTFGFFIQNPRLFPALPGWRGLWEPDSVLPEREMRYPWRGGQHPWLDAVIETPTHLIGIESKRYEPFDTHTPVEFDQEAYWRPVWGDEMGPYEHLRDSLSDEPGLFKHLNAVQLVKHAFGLRTQAARGSGKQPMLVYLHAEPSEWPDGKAIDPESHAMHREEVRAFKGQVEGAEVTFAHLTYRELLALFEASAHESVRAHGAAVLSHYRGIL